MSKLPHTLIKLLSTANSNQSITSERYPNDKIKSIKETQSGIVSSFNYEYDSLGRLTKVTKGDKNNLNQEIVERYAYDKHGNRVSSTVYGASRTGSYNSDDEPIAYADNSYQYDQDGFLKSKTEIDSSSGQSKTTTYTYGTLGELQSVTLPDNTIIRYYQNANNQRVAKEVNGTITQRYLWLNRTTLLGFYDKEGAFARFTYATDRTPIQMDYKEKSYYLSYNRIGSLKAIADQSKQIIKRIDYDSFGNILSQSNPTPSVTALDNLDIPIGFGGGLYDRDTNLIRFGYRDYDPFIGRWTAKDPIDFMGGQGNLYVYVGNDPINYVDPTGEFWQVIIGGIIAYYLVDVILDTYEYLIQAKIKIDNPQGIGSPEHRDQLRGALDDTAGFCRENAPISPIGNPVRLIPLPKNEHNKLFDIGYEFGNDLMRNNQSQGNGKQ